MERRRPALLSPPPRRSLRLLAAVALLLLPLATACRSAAPPPGKPVRSGVVERGIASWYGHPFHGRRTASGEVYDMHRLTAAHKTLPFGTLVEVTNLANRERVVVRVTDRGPFVRGRVIDLSYEAAKRIGMIGPGTARVELRVVGTDTAPPVVAEAPKVAPPGSGFTVQVGAFQERQRAEAVRSELARQYADVVVRSDGVWHRVQVGEFQRREAADELRGELASLGFTALVVLFP
jgi:rare lipoprotein A